VPSNVNGGRFAVRAGHTDHAEAYSWVAKDDLRRYCCGAAGVGDSKLWQIDAGLGILDQRSDRSCLFSFT
jgi:hypothetical protein